MKRIRIKVRWYILVPVILGLSKTKLDASIEGWISLQLSVKNAFLFENENVKKKIVSNKPKPSRINLLKRKEIVINWVWKECGGVALPEINDLL